MSTMKYFDIGTQTWQRVDSGAINDGVDRIIPSDLKSFHRSQLHSGFLNFGSISDFTLSISTLNAVKINRDLFVNLNSYYVKIPVNTLIQFSAPPSSGIRNDLAYLKATLDSKGYLTGATIQVADNANTLTNISYTLDSVDKGLYKNGSNLAIEICTIPRRNSGSYLPSNPNGAKNYYALGASNSITTTYTGSSVIITVPSTTGMQINDIIKSGANIFLVTAIGSSTQFTATYTTPTSSVSGVLNLTLVSDRVDGNYSNVIDSRDLQINNDLRHRTQFQYNFDYEVKRGSDQFMRGELSPKKLLKTYHGIPKTEIDNNTIFYASLDGTTVAEVGGTDLKNVTATFKPSLVGSGLVVSGYYKRIDVSTFNLNSAGTIDLLVSPLVNTSNGIFSLRDASDKCLLSLVMDTASTRLFLGTGNGTTYYTDTVLGGSTFKYTTMPEIAKQSMIPLRVTMAYSGSTTVIKLLVNGSVKYTITFSGQLPTIKDLVFFSTSDMHNSQNFSAYYANGILADISISNIDRGSLFPNLPADFISGDAVIMPAYTDQRRILSESQTTQTVNSIVKATNLLNSRGVSRVIIGTPNTWSANDTVTVTGMAGELISGVYSSPLATVIKDALSTDTVIYTDSVTGLVAGDEVKLVDRVLGTILATKTIATDGVDTTLKKVTFTATIGVALSKYQVVVMESTASSSVPLVYHMVAGVKTAVVGTWATLSTNVATFTLGTNAGLVAQDIQIDYSMIMPAGQPALSVPTTTTLMGEAGFRLPYANQTITSDYANKVSGRTWENPNIAKTLSAIVANNPAPTDFTTELITSEYAKMFTLDGILTTFSTSVNGDQAVRIHQLNTIKNIERKLGSKIPASTTALKVAWIKSNVSKLIPKLNCSGSSPTGNKATVAIRDNNSNTWTVGGNHTNAGITLISYDITSASTVTLANAIDANGILNVISYGDVSDGVTASVINNDYVSLDIVFQNKIVNLFGLATGQTVDVRDDFVGKVSGSVVENPNLFKYAPGLTTLQTPTGTWLEPTQGQLDLIKSLDNSLSVSSRLENGAIAQYLFSYNIIAIVEQKYGAIPAIDKVQWLKDNLSNVVCNWWGYGSGPSGNKAIIASWRTNSSSWVNFSTNNTTATVQRVQGVFSNIPESYIINSDGFVHFLAYADASDGVTASTIYTDYCNIELTFKKPTGYDVLSSSNPRRDAGLSNILLVSKNTKEVQVLFNWSNEYNLVTYSEYLEAPSPISASTEVTVLSEIPEWQIVDISSACGTKEGIHPWKSLAYRVGQDNLNLYGEIGISNLPFASDNINTNIGSKVTINGLGYLANYTKQYGLTAISKPLVGISRWLCMYNSQLYLLVLSKYVTNGSFVVDGAGSCYLIPIIGKNLVKIDDGIVRSGVVTPTKWATNSLVVEGFVSKATNTLITS